MSDNNLKLLGKRIFAARKICGLTQKELAQKAKPTPKTIQDIERGCKNPSYNTLIKLCDQLEISPETLFPSKAPVNMKQQCFIGKFQSCDQKNQKILLNTFIFLAEQLMDSCSDSSDPEQSIDPN